VEELGAGGFVEELGAGSFVEELGAGSRWQVAGSGWWVAIEWRADRTVGALLFLPMHRTWNFPTRRHCYLVGSTRHVPDE
jgi:hypothetical protein